MNFEPSQIENIVHMETESSLPLHSLSSEQDISLSNTNKNIPTETQIDEGTTSMVLDDTATSTAKDKSTDPPSDLNNQQTNNDNVTFVTRIDGLIHLPPQRTLQGFYPER
ncbi:unnamed protein product [Rhizophagus irregularis]|uniref:Uncharacterized protein n=1 Tax=Rhizophagus irregularis TaxID=588596 RepID=A0A2I1GU55_9GLOM|nr:hypothetical protein RhiirA4_529542 [Rhizophagus irregularis]CAB4402217.1 unnamed protein product [Rhizophagus irregularis]